MLATPAESVSRKLVARFVRPWSDSGLNAGAVRISLLLLLGFLCLIRAYVGLSGVPIHSTDASAMLDGAWRLQNGQTPHLDFYTPLGPVMYLLSELGLRLSHGGAEGLGYSQAITGGLLGIWTYWLTRRLRPFPAIVMCVAVFFLALNPVTVGEPPSNTAYMPYNRYGYALIGLLMVEAVTEARREEFQGGVSTGVTLAILLFLKITYFAGAMFLVAALAGCRRQTRERWLGILGGAGVVCLGFCWYLQFDLAAMWGDLRMASGAKPIEVNWWIVQNLRIPVASFLLLVSLSAAFLRSRAIALAGASTCVAGVFLLSTNFQFFDLPLNALMIILILNELSSEVPSQRSRALQRSGLLLFGMMFVFGCIAWDALGLGYGVANKRLWEQTAQARFDSTPMAAFHSFEREYIASVNDGLALVREHARSADTIMSLDFTDPFPYALGMKPAAGGATALHYGVNFTPAHHPDAARLFGAARLVLMPKKPVLEAALYRIYGPYLLANFQQVGESREWLLYRHN